MFDFPCCSGMKLDMLVTVALKHRLLYVKLIKFNACFVNLFFCFNPGHACGTCKSSLHGWDLLWPGSSTTYQIVKSLHQSVHVLDGTTVVSFLQPVPETYALLDDLILLSEGVIVYQGLCNLALEFFESMGVHQRKGLLTSCKRWVGNSISKAISVFTFPLQRFCKMRGKRASDSFEIPINNRPRIVPSLLQYLVF
jgi:hypothetical protein